MLDENIGKLGFLRAIRQDELELMLDWRNSPNVRANMYTRHEITLTEHLNWWNRIQENNSQQYFMYELNGTPMGIIGFNNVDIINRNSSWAFYASPTAPRGTGSKMELLALDHAFLDIKLHKLCCEVLAFNKPVISLHQKFGFEVEGILREQHFADNLFVDVYRLGMLESEWQKKRSSMYEKILKI